MSRWGEIESRLTKVNPTGGDKRPTNADLDAFEVAAGILLPLDYRRFALAYGHGSTSAPYEFEIHTPSDPAAGALNDLEATRAQMAGFFADKATAAGHGCDPEQFRRLILFSSVRDVAESFAWDTGDVTDPAEHEMAVYLIGGDLRPRVYRVASSFGEFFVDYLLKGRYGRECHPNYRKNDDAWELGEPIFFYHVPSSDPAPPRRKKMALPGFLWAEIRVQMGPKEGPSHGHGGAGSAIAGSPFPLVGGPWRGWPGGQAG